MTGRFFLVHLIGLYLVVAPPNQGEDTYAQFDDSERQAVSLMSSGNYAEAIIVGEPALRKARLLFAAEEPKFIDFEMLMALAYMEADRPQDAQPLLLAVVQSRTGPSTALRDAEFYLAMQAGQQGLSYESNQRLRIALAVALSLPVSEAPAAERIRNSLAQSDLTMGDTPEALELTIQNLDYIRDHPGEASHREELFNLRTLAAIYRSIGDRRREDDICAQLQQISATPGEKNDTELVILARDRDRLFEEGHFDEALRLQLAVMSKTEKATGTHPLTTAKGLQFVAQIHYAAGDTQAALESFRKAFELLHQAYSQTFASMTDSERNEFAIELDGTLNLFYSMCYKYRTSHPEWLAQMYDLILWQKNLVSRSLRQQQQSLAGSNDDLLRTLQSELRVQRILVAEASTHSTDTLSLGSLRQKEYDLESQIAQRVSLLSGGAIAGPNIGAILKVLGPSDAAVEIVRVPFNDGPAPTSQVIYMAILARTGTQQPLTLIELGDADKIELDQIQLNDLVHSRGTKPNADDAIPESDVWKALEAPLKGTKRVYLSPSGIINEAPFFSWKASDGRFLIDHADLDLRPVSSTAVLLDGKSTTTPTAVLLIGNPDFNNAPSEAMASPNVVAEPSSAAHVGCQDVVSEKLQCLPDSGNEVTEIYSVLKSKGWEVLPPLESGQASKAAVLATRHPRVLHLATHGFFAQLDDSGAEVDPVGLEMQLESSGLYFAGANITLRDHPSQSPDNGILTAFEALNMDLDGTELVVLSACETGRGQLSNANEVLGLRRSFQVAGATNILMSMWNVNDPATTELMTKFYASWAATGDAYDALRNAALEIKKNNPSPYYWAPFVLYGGK